MKLNFHYKANNQSKFTYSGRIRFQYENSKNKTKKKQQQPEQQNTHPHHTASNVLACLSIERCSDSLQLD